MPEKDRRAPLIPGQGPLSRLPVPLVFLLVIAAFLAGVLIGGLVGVLLLGLLALLVLGLLAVTWRSMTPGERVPRLLTLVMLLLIALTIGQDVWGP